MLNTLSSIITFRALSHEDCSQLHQWLQCTHVREFWDDGDRTLKQVEAHYFRKDKVNHYLFLINDQPVGFIQSYTIDATHENARFIPKNQTAMGVDFFIGNKAYLGQGYAILVLTKFISSYCQNADCILVDPDPSNKKAIHIYQKYGFVKVGECRVKNKLYWVMVSQLKKTSDLS